MRPGVSAFVSWLAGIDHDVRAEDFCNATDFVVLESLYSMTGGTGWTESSGWLEGAALEAWYGISADSLGRVVALDLTDNGLSGKLPSNMGELARMSGLWIGTNSLSGRLPLSLARAPLRELDYTGTELCAPADPAFQSWLLTIPSHEGTGVECAPLADREILEVLYEATGGTDWANNDNWLTEEPLQDWHGVRVGGDGRVISVNLGFNDLRLHPVGTR